MANTGKNPNSGYSTSALFNSSSSEDELRNFFKEALKIFKEVAQEDTNEERKSTPSTKRVSHASEDGKNEITPNGIDRKEIWEKAGEQIAKTLVSSISKYTDAWAASVYGKFDISGSFAKGTSLFSSLRSDMGQYSFARTLKEQTEVITGSYEQLKKEGILVDPNAIYGIYKDIGSLVNLTGLTNERLSDVVTAVTRLDKSGGVYDTSSYYGTYNLQLNTAAAEAMNAAEAIVKSYFDTPAYNDAVSKAIVNSESFQYALANAGYTGNNYTAYAKDLVAQRANVAGGLSEGGLSSSAITALLGYADKLISPDTTLNSLLNESPILGTGVIDRLGQLSGGQVTPTNLANNNWIIENSDAVVQAIIDTIQSTPEITENSQVRSQLSKYLGFDNQTMAQILGFSGGLSTGNSVTEEQIDNFYTSIDDTRTAADKLNYELVEKGLISSSLSAENNILTFVAGVYGILDTLNSELGLSSMVKEIIKAIYVSNGIESTSNIVGGIIQGAAAGTAAAGTAAAGSTAAGGVAAGISAGVVGTAAGVAAFWGAEAIRDNADANIASMDATNGNELYTAGTTLDVTDPSMSSAYSGMMNCLMTGNSDFNEQYASDDNYRQVADAYIKAGLLNPNIPEQVALFNDLMSKESPWNKTVIDNEGVIYTNAHEKYFLNTMKFYNKGEGFDINRFVNSTPATSTSPNNISHNRWLSSLDALEKHATGLDAVPYDGYMAMLHEGEMVIPARRANWLRNLLGVNAVTPSKENENKNTGDNSFVQGIPQYASGIDSVQSSASFLSKYSSNPLVERILANIFGSSNGGTISSSLDTNAMNPVLAAAIKAIGIVEGNYGSVNPDDNGSLSLGRLQWHGTRAGNLLKNMYDFDSSGFSALTQKLGIAYIISQLDNTNYWKTKKIASNEKSAWSQLISAYAGVQDSIVNEDVSRYIAHGQNNGVSTDAASVLWANFENKMGSGGIFRLFPKGNTWNWDSMSKSLKSNANWNNYQSRYNKTSQVLTAAGIPLLADGGIVTEPTLSVIGEGKHDEAVVPLKTDEDYLGIQETGINIIDAIDIATSRICEKLDAIISQGNNSNSLTGQSLTKAQKSARHESLVNFSGVV